MDIRALYKLISQLAWIPTGNIHVPWAYTWISLLKIDQQIPAYPCSIQSYINARKDIDTDTYNSSMDIHVYTTDIHMDSSTWSW